MVTVQYNTINDYRIEGVNSMGDPQKATYVFCRRLHLHFQPHLAMSQLFQAISLRRAILFQLHLFDLMTIKYI